MSAVVGERPVVPPVPALGGIDHLEWWVGNARAFAGFLAAAFGFRPVAYAGPETGRREALAHREELRDKAA